MNKVRIQKRERTIFLLFSSEVSPSFDFDNWLTEFCSFQVWYSDFWGLKRGRVQIQMRYYNYSKNVWFDRAFNFLESSLCLLSWVEFEFWARNWDQIEILMKLFQLSDSENPYTICSVFWSRVQFFSFQGWNVEFRAYESDQKIRHYCDSSFDCLNSTCVLAFQIRNLGTNPNRIENLTWYSKSMTREILILLVCLISSHFKIRS